MLSYQMENPRTLKNFAEKQLCLQYGLLDILSPLLRPTGQKKVSFKMALFTDNVPGHPRLTEYTRDESFYSSYRSIHLQFMDQGVILTFKFYYLQYIS